jgi:hypothetical protein
VNSSFRNKLQSDIEDEYGDKLSHLERDLIDCALYVLQHRAHRRVRDALVMGMGAEKTYNFDAKFKTAVDMLAQAAVNAVFGDNSPTQAELATAYNMVAAKLFASDEEKDAWLAQHPAQSTPVTMENVIAALEPMKAITASPAYGKVTMGNQTNDVGPPATAPTVEELLEIVERRSKELAGQKAVRAKLETAKKKYPGVFGPKGFVEFDCDQ